MFEHGSRCVVVRTQVLVCVPIAMCLLCWIFVFLFVWLGCSPHVSAMCDLFFPVRGCVPLCGVLVGYLIPCIFFLLCFAFRGRAVENKVYRS